jgi:hypothetical protein
MKFFHSVIRETNHRDRSEYLRPLEQIKIKLNVTKAVLSFYLLNGQMWYSSHTRHIHPSARIKIKNMDRYHRKSTKLQKILFIMEYTRLCIKLKKGKKLMKKLTESKFNFSSKSIIKNKFITVVDHTVENFHVNALFL